MNYARMSGRDDRIRTCDILLPKQARYQTAPRPVRPLGEVYSFRRLLATV